jgi:hypothetical protein
MTTERVGILPYSYEHSDSDEPAKQGQVLRSDTFGADAGSAGVGHYGSRREREPLEVVMAAKRPDFEREMELAGLEPATSWVRSRRSPS